MPMYEFFCKKCDKAIESIEKSEVKEIKCLTCDSVCVKMFPTKFNFKLLGGGWYKDGYSKR